MDEISVLENFFKSRQVLLARQWLESCISWCKQENLPRNYTIKDLQFNVFEQWLLLDLRDVEIPCLPPDLSSKVKYTLNGNYSLQVMQIEDISKPKHWQLQRIRKSIPKNLEQDAEISKRALLVTLSDGVQEVLAMEYQPVKCLNLNLSPGIKVRLMGPVEVRRGRVMLAERNIKILGGEVDSLLVPNAAENVLAKHLNLPLNMEPTVIQESILAADTTLLDEQGNVTSQLPPDGSLAARIPPNQARIQPTRSENVPEQNPQISDEINYMEVEQSMIEDEIKMMMEAENEIEESRVKRRKPNGDAFHNIDIDDAALGNIEIPEIVEVPPPEIPKISGNIHEESDFFSDIDLDAHLDKIEEESKPNTPSQTHTIWTIAKLSKNLPNISKGKFKIRAKFTRIVERLEVVDGEFHLVVEMTDVADDIVVKFHTNVVADLYGCSASAVIELKSQVRQGNFMAGEKMKDGLRRLAEELIKIDGIAEVQVTKGDKFPLVVRLL